MLAFHSARDSSRGERLSSKVVCIFFVDTSSFTLCPTFFPGLWLIGGGLGFLCVLPIFPPIELKAIIGRKGWDLGKGGGHSRCFKGGDKDGNVVEPVDDDEDDRLIGKDGFPSNDIGCDSKDGDRGA